VVGWDPINYQVTLSRLSWAVTIEFKVLSSEISPSNIVGGKVVFKYIFVPILLYL
jgi:hypothetical protein